VVSTFPVVAVQNCPLCGASGPLCESHIIPHFVIQWLRESSATGYIRFAGAPNLRVQDGIKQRLLCAACEALLSGWEKETAERLFKPFHRDSRTVLPYGSWLAKFCASLCWRVLFVYRGLGLDHLSEQQLQLVPRALDFWQDLMFGRREHPGEFELHVLPLPAIDSAEGFDMPPNMNRYFARELEADVVATGKSAFVQVKICRLMVLGFVQMPNAHEWKGTRVKMRRGSIGGPQNFFLPKNFGDYLIERAKHAAKVQASISEPQKQKIVAAMRNDLDRAESSDTFEAMSHDVKMFGPAAFGRPKR
jgi:hypothetical protein